MSEQGDAILFAIDMLSHRDDQKVEEALDIILENAEGLEFGHGVALLANMNSEHCAVPFYIDTIVSICTLAGMPYMGPDLLGVIGDTDALAALMKEYM